MSLVVQSYRRTKHSYSLEAIYLVRNLLANKSAKKQSLAKFLEDQVGRWKAYLNGKTNWGFNLDLERQVYWEEYINATQTSLRMANEELKSWNEGLESAKGSIVYEVREAKYAQKGWQRLEILSAHWLLFKHLFVFALDLGKKVVDVNKDTGKVSKILGQDVEEATDKTVLEALPNWSPVTEVATEATPNPLVEKIKEAYPYWSFDTGETTANELIKFNHDLLVHKCHNLSKMVHLLYMLAVLHPTLKVIRCRSEKLKEFWRKRKEAQEKEAQEKDKEAQEKDKEKDTLERKREDAQEFYDYIVKEYNNLSPEVESATVAGVFLQIKEDGGYPKSKKKAINTDYASFVKREKEAATRYKKAVKENRARHHKVPLDADELGEVWWRFLVSLSFRLYMPAVAPPKFRETVVREMGQEKKKVGRKRKEPTTTTSTQPQPAATTATTSQPQEDLAATTTATQPQSAATTATTSQPQEDATTSQQQEELAATTVTATQPQPEAATTTVSIVTQSQEATRPATSSTTAPQPQEDAVPTATQPAANSTTATAQATLEAGAPEGQTAREPQQVSVAALCRNAADYHNLPMAEAVAVSVAQESGFAEAMDIATRREDGGDQEDLGLQASSGVTRPGPRMGVTTRSVVPKF